jgi:hypothetical protein
MTMKYISGRVRLSPRQASPFSFSGFGILTQGLGSDFRRN